MTPVLLHGQIRYSDTNQDNLQLRLLTLTSDTTGGILTETGGIAKISIDTGRRFKTRIKASGDLVLFLELDHVFDLQIKAHGTVKCIVINLMNIPEQETTGGFLLDMDVTFPQDLNRDQQRYLRQTPIGRCGYDSTTHSIEFDFDYTDQVKAHLESLAD